MSGAASEVPSRSDGFSQRSFSHDDVLEEAATGLKVTVVYQAARLTRGIRC